MLALGDVSLASIQAFAKLCIFVYACATPAQDTGTVVRRSCQDEEADAWLVSSSIRQVLGLMRKRSTRRFLSTLMPDPRGDNG